MKLKILSRIAAMIIIMGFAVTLSAQTEAEAVDALKDGVAKSQAKDYLGAIASFEKCVSIYDELDLTNSENRATAATQIPKMQYKHALGFYKEKKYDESIAAFEKLIEYSETYNDPDNAKKAKLVIPQLYYFKGKTFAESDNFTEAIENYEKAIELKSNYFDPFFRLAGIYSDQKNDELFAVNVKKAIEVTTKADKKDAANSLAIKYYNNMGVEALNKKNYDAALGYFNTLMEYKKADEDIYYQLAVIYNKQSNWNAAIESANKALELMGEVETKDAKIHFELGNSYYGKGDNAAACEAYKNAAKGDYEASAKYQIETVLKCQ
ncbi:tetratricopeptide repeat protein [Bacteroidota bacterium]